MDFNREYNIFAEAKAVCNMKSPLETFTPDDIGSFVLAWSSKDAPTSVRGTLMGFGCDTEGEYVMVKGWVSGLTARYTLVVPLPEELLPSKKCELKMRRDPEVKQPGMPL